MRGGKMSGTERDVRRILREIADMVETERSRQNDVLGRCKGCPRDRDGYCWECQAGPIDRCPASHRYRVNFES